MPPFEPNSRKQLVDIRRKSPCVGICSTGIGDLVCRGCKRFFYEVIDWNSYTPDQKEAIHARLRKLLHQTLEHSLVIVDAERMQRLAAEHSLPVFCDESMLDLAYRLLQSSAGSIQDVRTLGIDVAKPGSSRLSQDLAQRIEEHFYRLSEAHYEYYFSRLAADRAKDRKT